MILQLTSSGDPSGHRSRHKKPPFPWLDLLRGVEVEVTGEKGEEVKEVETGEADFGVAAQGEDQMQGERGSPGHRACQGRMEVGEGAVRKE